MHCNSSFRIHLFCLLLLFFAAASRLPAAEADSDQDAFGLALHAGTAAEAIAAVRTLEDQKLLARVAEESAWKAARSEAIAHLTDQELVADIVHKGDWFLRWAILPRIQDPVLLAEVARKDPDPFVREDAIKLVKDAAVLQDAYRHDPDGRVREAAVYTLRDQPALADIALHAADHDLRQVALNVLTDRQFLKTVAVKTGEADLRKQALFQMDDQKALEELLASQGSSRDLRLDIVPLLQNQKLLKEIATAGAEDPAIRAAAAEKVTDQSVLAGLSAPDQPVAVRLAVVNATRDASMVAHLARSDNDPKVRLAAIGRLDDAAILTRLAQEERDETLRARAVSRLNDRALLARILVQDPSPRVRREAVARVQDKDVLRAALKDQDAGVRATAVVGIPDDPQTLEHLALSDPEAPVRRNATARLQDATVLDRILRRDPSAEVRRAAMARLTDPTSRSAYLENGSDWQLRREAALTGNDLAGLEKTAAHDSDRDVREAAFQRIYDLQLTGRLKDEALQALVLRFNQEAVPATGDPREDRLKADLSDPALAANFGGPLTIQVRRKTSERRYALERPGGGYPPLRGKVVVETWQAVVKSPKGQVLSDRSYEGRKAGKAYAFDGPFPVENGVYVKHNNATVDFVEICKDVLHSSSGSTAVAALGKSENKDLRTAADLILHP